MASGVNRARPPAGLAGRPAPEHAGPVLVESRNETQPAVRRWGWVETAVLAGYAVVAALGIAWHEPWADEAQAWLMARDMGWWQLMMHGIRYEGSPGLWHTFCWILIRLHVGFTGLHWASGIVAAAGVAVLLRWSPFPLLLRILLPFGFWLAYQDAAIARSYVMYAVIAFPAAAILRGMMQSAPMPRGRLVGLAVLLGLMANLSVYGFIASLGLVMVAVVLLRRRAGAGYESGARWRVPAVIVGCFWLFAVVTTFPPSDVSFMAGKNFERSADKILAGIGDRQARLKLQAIRPPTEDVLPGELRPKLPKPHHWTSGQALWHKVARILSLFTFPVSNYRVLALLLCVLSIAQALWFRAGPGMEGQAGWIGLVPWLLMILVFTSMYIAPRHAGMLWTTLLVVLWLTWPAEHPNRRLTESARWLHQALVAVLVVVAIDQIGWTARCVWADVRHPYCGDVAMAQFLRREGRGKRIAGFYYYTVGTAAWFEHPIYFNQPSAYWEWTRNQRTVQQAPMAIATHPDMIVVGLMAWGPKDANISDDWIAPTLADLPPSPLGDSYGIAPYAEAHGYHITHRFCGDAFMRAGYAEKLCMEALEPSR